MSSGGLNIVGHRFQRSERVAGPLHSDEAEQPMLDRVPLRGAGRVVADSNGETVASGDLMVQAIFPNLRSVAITASTVAEQQDSLHGGIVSPAEFRNPCIQASF